MPANLKKNALQSIPSNAPSARRKILNLLADHMAPDDVLHFDQPTFNRTAEIHWKLADRRGTGAPRIDIEYATINGHRRTVIEAVSDDMAFLVDSIAAEINKRDYLIELLLHPIYYAKYDSKGVLEDITDKPRENYIRQSHIHVQIRNTLSEDAQKDLKKGVMAALNDVALCNRDWRTMLDELKHARTELSNAKTRHGRDEIQRHCAFLDYLYNNNYTLLGYREYKFTETGGEVRSQIVKSRSLGLLHDNVLPAYINENEESLPRHLQKLRRDLPPVSISKTNRLATVHRRVPMDAIAVKKYDSHGKVVGEHLFLGLFTSVTYSRSVGDVPYLREKVDDVIAESGFLPGSHNGKALRHILEKYPRDELFQISNADLLKVSNDILRLQERQRIAVFMRRDPFGRYISCLVYVPRDRFGTTLRRQIIKILETELSGTCTNFTTSMDDSVFARMVCAINVRQKSPPRFDEKAIESKIIEAGQTWPERLAAALMQGTSPKAVVNEEQVTHLTLKYGEAFPVSYTSRYQARQAIFDIDKTEECLRTNALALDLYNLNDEGPNVLRLKVYNPGSPLNLSDVLPILENMDLRAISELPFEIKPAQQAHSIWIHDFQLQAKNADIAQKATQEFKTVFEDAFARIWRGEVENDSLNRLVLSAGLNYREVIILRTYVRYMRQIGLPYSRNYIEDALVKNAGIAFLLASMFRDVHDPANKKPRAAMASEYKNKIEKNLENVTSLDEDRILRTFLSLIDATLRTNFFQTDLNGNPKSYLSIKLDSKRIADLPEPKPYREMFVYSPRVEAVHLRGDKIARGGIRWSDRHEDFRTEILGLMKAQMVKNAVIVPMGAKGGFIVKTPNLSHDNFRKEGIECYKTMVRGFLDITDNLKGSKVVPPTGVVRLDGDDPYLVVAADKGTATFSDIANGISKEYGFWMDDAFASGGSAGYDHKHIGITARGAWESIKFHFSQLNHDIQSRAFDVVGVGDMGGDVFGNGMLLSKHIHLIGAFNHAHIFCDPAPDAAISFKERTRLFKGVLGWDHYDIKKLSKGGRIYARTEKSLTLTPEIQKRFDIAKDKVTPAELIRAILKSRTDLLYFGGIGTYIKSSKQSHADAGDKTNDALRIDALELRAKVIGEGANLALTQLARIEFAEQGGRINTDFIDNSGGVDTSDHEVNIKILMTDVMAGGGMNLAARDKLLREMTDEVAALVLRDNYQQTQAISLAEIQARDNLKAHEELIHDLESRIGLNRALEGLPSAQIIEERLRHGRGMTRPELCILLAYAKIVFTQDILSTTIPDSADMQEWAVNYFPQRLRKKYSKEISRHRLRREIIAMAVANSIVNRMGPSFVASLSRKTGASAETIVRAYLAARDAFDLSSVWASIESLGADIPKETKLKALREAASLAESATHWFIVQNSTALISNDRRKFYRASIGKIKEKIHTLSSDDMRTQIKQRIDNGIQNHLPRDMAELIAIMPFLKSACDIAKIASDTKSNANDVAKDYFEIGARFGFDWLLQQASFMHADTRWQSEAIAGLTENLRDVQAIITVHTVRSGLKKWISAHESGINDMDTVLAALRAAGSVDLPMLVIAEQKLRALAVK
jgi:glutamate dehydrogenase